MPANDPCEAWQLAQISVHSRLFPAPDFFLVHVHLPDARLAAAENKEDC